MKWIKDIISSDKDAAMLIMTNPGIELLGRSVKDAVTDGEVHYQSINALNERFPQAIACTSIMDLTVEAEAFGAEIVMPDDEVPVVTGRLLSSFADVEALKIPSLTVGRIPEYLKANILTAENIDKPVFAGCIGPFSLAGRLFDMTEIMIAMYTEPETIELLLEKCTLFLLEYCKAIKETGVFGLIMAEPAAGLMSNEDCSRFSSVYVKRIIEALQDESFPIILHNCGNTGHCTSAMIETGAKGLHFGNKIDMKLALEQCSKELLVMGNIDPVEVLKLSSAEEVIKHTKQLMADTAKYPNFVISSGCDVPPNIPFENIEAFYSCLK